MTLGTDKTTGDYDSDWEKKFKWCLLKYLPRGFTLENQKVFNGLYRVDYTITCDQTGNVWIFEFDGKQFHDFEKDLHRDKDILDSNNHVRSITRVDASTYIHYYDECRGKLYELVPACFDIDPNRIKPGGSYYMCGDHYLRQDSWFHFEDTHYARKIVDCDENHVILEGFDGDVYPASLKMYKLQIIHRQNHA